MVQVYLLEFFSLFFNVLLDNCVLKLDRFDFLSYCVF